MDIRQPIHSEHARTLDTDGLRRHFLVEEMFEADAMTLTYSQIDRIIVGGIMPVGKSVTFGESLAKHTGTSYVLERRELGLINIGGAATVLVDECTQPPYSASKVQRWPALQARQLIWGQTPVLLH